VTAAHDDEVVLLAHPGEPDHDRGTPRGI